MHILTPLPEVSPEMEKVLRLLERGAAHESSDSRAQSQAMVDRMRLAAGVGRLVGDVADALMNRKKLSRPPVRSLPEQVEQVLAKGPAFLVLVPGDHKPRELEPLAQLDVIVGNAAVVAVSEGWPEPLWQRSVEAIAVKHGMSGEQRMRARGQRIEDGTLDVLLCRQGRVVGSKLVNIWKSGTPGRDANAAARDLVVSAVNAGLPGLAEVARRIGIGVPQAAPPAPARPTPAPVSPQPTPSSAQPRSSGQVPRSGQGPSPGAPTAQPRNAPGVVPPFPQPPPPPPVGTGSNQHAVEAGRCTRCKASGAALAGPCGRADLGRIGLIELD